MRLRLVKRLSQAGAVEHHFGKAEVSQHDIARLPHQNVLELQIPVRDVVLVQEADGDHDLDDEELDLLFCELFYFTQMLLESASADVLENEVDPGLALESTLHVHYKNGLQFISRTYFSLTQFLTLFFFKRRSFLILFMANCLPSLSTIKTPWSALPS